MNLDLTFFVWSDTHYGYQPLAGSADLRARIIAQMHDLPGWPYPESIGGVVATPEFVVLDGDAVDGAPGAGPTELALFEYGTARLRFPQVEVMGNHDTDPAYAGWFVARYGGRSHAFDRQGVHFVALNTHFGSGDPGHFEAEELDFLRRDADAAGAGTPTIVFTHHRLDRTTNGGDVLALLARRNVLLVVSAHVHKPAVFQLDGIDCIDVGQCRDHPIDPEYGRSFLVVRVTDERLTAVPWRWDLADWERGQRWADPEAVARRFTLIRDLQAT